MFQGVTYLPEESRLNANNHCLYTLDYLPIINITNMEKVAKLVTISLRTRVIVAKDATDEEIIKASKSRFIDIIQCCAGDNIEQIDDDDECPHDEPDDEHDH